MQSERMPRTPPGCLAVVGGLLVGAWSFLCVVAVTLTLLSETSSYPVAYVAVGLGLICGLVVVYLVTKRLLTARARNAYVLVSVFGVLTALAFFINLNGSKAPIPHSPDINLANYPQFPWPPPLASERVVLPPRFFPTPPNRRLFLRDVDFKLTTALDSAGYLERSYYAVPDGFALITRLEQINADGTPKSGDQRWLNQEEPLRRFSLKEYVALLITAKSGFYRVIAFIVTPHEFVQSDATVSEQQAQDWLAFGMNKLPPPIGVLVYSRQYACTALIFEFQQPGIGQEVKFIAPGKLAAQVHLVKANIWSGLER